MNKATHLRDPSRKCQYARSDLLERERSLRVDARLHRGGECVLEKDDRAASTRSPSTKREWRPVGGSAAPGAARADRRTGLGASSRERGASSAGRRVGGGLRPGRPRAAPLLGALRAPGRRVARLRSRGRDPRSESARRGALRRRSPKARRPLPPEPRSRVRRLERARADRCRR